MFLMINVMSLSASAVERCVMDMATGAQDQQSIALSMQIFSV